MDISSCVVADSKTSLYTCPRYPNVVCFSCRYSSTFAMSDPTKDETDKVFTVLKAQKANKVSEFMPLNIDPSLTAV